MRETASAVFLFASVASPNFAFGATEPVASRSVASSKPVAAVQSAQEPSSDLIEFIGEWGDDAGDIADPAAIAALPANTAQASTPPPPPPSRSASSSGCGSACP